MQLLNKDGHTVQVEYTGQGIYIKDGGLPTSYKLDQFHFHWGAIDTRGSENIIDNIHFPMELHIVHRQNSSNSFRNAASYPSGLAVIGFFFKVVAEDNERLNRHLLRFLSMVIHTDQMAHIPAFALSEILPDLNNLDYYRFDGSLTYPPCHESVIWSVATEFIPISKSQLNMFRNLQTRDQNPMVDNFRPPQNLNQRRVYTTKNLNQRREYTGRSLGVGITAGEGWVTTSQIILLAYTTRKVLYDPLLPRFDLSHYNRTDGVYMQLLNKDGHTVQVEYTGQGIYIKDGGLPTSYKLDQFHFHWGAIDTRGSENIIDNIHFPMELHIVHRQNSSNSFRNAASYPSGLAVIGFFFKVVAEDNEKLNRHLLRFLSMVIHTDQMAHIPTFALSEILPDISNLDYYRFDGSLTFPPCHESVIWSVATEFIPISKSQ
ncbi:carbonic anhydrase 1-like, partial [Physella acuta]|uniref:carbonic anhydrase 1-like n=1 Tax=Physella acuta TaxID=109671 RepID=UPI0027DDCD2D